jgi:hypothetical protein
MLLHIQRLYCVAAVMLCHISMLGVIRHGLCSMQAVQALTLSYNKETNCA